MLVHADGHFEGSLAKQQQQFDEEVHVNFKPRPRRSIPESCTHPLGG